MAYGEKYCRLAEHLYMSYKLFGNCDYPFYCITDSRSADSLRKTFDGVIVKDNFVKSTSDKLMFFTDNPFDESVFIDSDCSIVNDVNYIFDLFSENGSPISAIADIKDLREKQKGRQFGVNAIKELCITKDFPNFNGGVYYYRKTDLTNIYVDFMINDVLPNYHYYGCLSDDKNIVIYDEPIVILCMLKYGFIPVPPSKNIMYLVHNKTRVKWNMKNHISTYKWYECIVHPTIIHWKVGGTETFNYEKYDAKIRGLFYKSRKLSIIKNQIIAFGKYYVYPKLLKISPKFRNIIIKNR
ncbi:MAG: hypothetical protein IKZ47_01590 [Clostridia bacterium]|nr:hypothetical protein [Clostridia bacterium]MBR4910000.1 hypothetical protein [Clostridia bacterium]